MSLKKCLQAGIGCILLLNLVAGVSTAPQIARAAGLVVVSAAPQGSGAGLDTQITVSFNQAIQPATFSGTINGAALVATQIVPSADLLSVSIDPGELEYGREYQVVVAGSVLDAAGDPLGTDYSFSFTTQDNPASKRPTTTLALPGGPYQSGQTYTLSGQAAGYVWQRDADNPLELVHWDEAGNIIGTSPMLHPAAMVFPGGMDGYQTWLYYTPYPPGNHENPVLMRSVDGENGFTAAGVPQNPLFAYNYQPPFDMQNLADPEAYRLGQTWMLFYEMETPYSTAAAIGDWMHGGGYIGLALSSDGLSWEPYGGAYTYDPLNPPTGYPANGNPVIYPESSYYYEDDPGCKMGEIAVFFKDGQYHLWRTVLDGGGVVAAYDTAPDPRGPWAKQGVAVNFGGYNLGPHVDVVYDAERDLYLMIYLTPSGTNVGQLGLYTAESPAGPWKPHPLNPIFRAQDAWEGSALYRASLAQDGTQWRMYYSGDIYGNPQIGLAREVPGVRTVEISTNGGSTWQAASVAPDGSWSFDWTPGSDGNYAITARVSDDFMRGAPLANTSVTVGDVGLPAAEQPMLVLTNSAYTANPFSAYLAELLRGVGLVEFQSADLGDLMADADPQAYLAAFDIVLLAETSLDSAQETLLRNYVNGGGALVAMRPDPDLADLFGLTYAGARSEELLQFLKFETGSGPGVGIVNLSLQYHGQADNYTLNGAQALGYLWNSLTTASSNPAVSQHAYGSGQAVAFSFDLAKSIVLTRQGNPAWKDTEGDGLGGYRPEDTFFRTNGDKWLAPERTRVPQADEEQRFLANLIQSLAPHPLPRLWYLPNGEKVVFINTGDDEGMGGTELNQILNDAASYGGTFTHFLMTSGISSTDAALEATWRAAGHETGPHVYGGGPDTCAALEPAYANIIASLIAKFGHGAISARSHTIDWCGWSDMAEIEANNGTRMDTNYYHYLPPLLGYGDNANGYFTGSGLPMKFSNESGAVLNIYQAATQWPDEWFADNGFSATATTQIMQDMIEDAQNGYYSAFVANIHPVRYYGIDAITHTWANAIWAYLQANGIPMWTGEKLYYFVRARDASQFEAINWNGSILSFDFSTPFPGQELTLMIPAMVGANNLLGVTVDGAPVTLTTETITGRDYGLFTLSAGSGHVVASFGVDETAPLISAVQAVDITDVSARITWSTDEPASSRVDFGTTSGNLVVSETNSAYVTAHSLSLTGLSPNTTYYYTVTSTDQAGNSAVSSEHFFVTGSPRWLWTTVADFNAGTQDRTQVVAEGDGAFMLAPASGLYDHFDGAALDTNVWEARNILGAPDITVSLADSWVTVNNYTYIRSKQTFFKKTVEGQVTLATGPNAHFGWATTVQAGDDGIADPHWMIFSSKDGTIQARTRLDDGQGTNEEINTTLAGISPGVPHVFKIVWNEDNSIEFWVDGYHQVTHNRAFPESDPIRVLLTSNAAQSGSANWIRVSGAYETGGSHISSAADCGGNCNFGELLWEAVTPPGTSLGFETHTSLDALTWSPWEAVGAGGAIASPAGRYLQFRAALATTDIGVSPRVDQVSVTYQSGPDLSPPQVSSTIPTHGATGVAPSTNITINYNEPVDPATFLVTISGGVTFTTSFLNGGRSVVLDPTADLAQNTGYSVTVAAGVEDLTGNPTVDPFLLLFTTSREIRHWMQTTLADFQTCTANGVVLSQDDDGEVRLPPSFYDLYSGDALDSQWTSANWGGGAYTPVVSGGLMTFSQPGGGAYIHSLATFEPEITLQGRVRFERSAGNVPYMYFGLAGNNLVPWALFGTGYTGDQVYTSVYHTGLGSPVTFGLGDLFNQWHTYKIIWKPASIEFWVDGTLVRTETIAISGPLSVYFSIGPGTPSDAHIVADWVRVDQYGTSETVVTPVELVNDTFTQPDGPNPNWTPQINPSYPTVNWSVVGGTYRNGPEGTSYHPSVPAAAPAVSNFDFRTRAMSPDAGGLIGLVWGLQDYQHNYFAQFYGGTLTIYKLNIWPTFTNLGSFSVPGVPSANTWYNLRVTGANNSYSIYVNDVLRATVSDSTFPSGKVGVLGYGGSTSFYDDVVFSEVQSVTEINPVDPGTCTSQVFDAGEPVEWLSLTAQAQNPANTGLAFRVRSGTTPSPDVSWSDWVVVSGSTFTLPDGRYFQYEVTLSTEVVNASPVLEALDFAYSPIEQPTAVDIAGFEAGFENGFVRLAWETVTEVEIIGFNLYRSQTPNGVRVKLNPALIEAHDPGGVTGNRYEFIDPDGLPGGLMVYWLEVKEAGGGATIFGPLAAAAPYQLYLPLMQQ